jgi:UDP-3-O-[3-hydroxymyristoyl] glucosamine N-acyltransferase
MAKIQEIAELLGVAAGTLEYEISQVSSIDAATPVSLVFATDARSLVAALNSSAGLILTSARFAEEAGQADPRVLDVADPRLAFSQVARMLRPAVKATIHPSAIVSALASVGEGTSAGPGAVIEDNVRLGRDCVIGPKVIIYAGVEIGNRVTVQAGAVLGSTGFGYARDGATGEYLLFPQQGALVIEDDVEIGANTTIDRGALEETRIGRGTKIDNLVHIGHNCRIGKNVIIAAQTGISGSSVVEDGAILGGQVGIGEHATVGPGVILGGGAGVLSGKKMQGPGEVFWGRPARPLKEYLRDLARLKKR